MLVIRKNVINADQLGSTQMRNDSTTSETLQQKAEIPDPGDNVRIPDTSSLSSQLCFSFVGTNEKTRALQECIRKALI